MKVEMWVGWMVAQMVVMMVGPLVAMMVAY